jgi:hypothetical protein
MLASGFMCLFLPGTGAQSILDEDRKAVHRFIRGGAARRVCSLYYEIRTYGHNGEPQKEYG